MNDDLAQLRLWADRARKAQRAVAPSTDHILACDGHHGHCTRCGATLDLELPMSIGDVVRAFERFIEQHRWCPEKA